MRGVSIEAPGRAVCGTFPEPVLHKDEVLLEICRIGLCGSDLNTYRGTNPLVVYPRVPGHEVAGRIVEYGPEVSGPLAKGMLVTVLPYTTCGGCSACLAGRPNACRDNQTLGVQRDGALSEWLAVPAGKIIVAPALDERALALVEPLSVGFHAVDRGRVHPSDTVLVFGCGMIGLGVIAAAGLDRGASVIAVDVDDAKLSLAKACGARHTINSSRGQFEEIIQELTAGQGPNVVFEAVGLPQTFQSAVKMAGFGGRVVYIGYAKEPVSYETKFFVMKELDILGSRNAMRSDFDRVIGLLESGQFPTAKCITRETSLSEAPAAFESWSSNASAQTKIHVVFRNESSA